MKRIALAVIYVMSLHLVFAQDEQEEIWRIWYMKPVQGKSKLLERGIKKHVIGNHNKGQWSEYYYSVLSGPNSGSLMGWSGPHTWKDFDERKRSQKDVDHWNKYVVPYLDNSSSGTDFLVYHPELSYEDTSRKEPWPPIYHLSWNYTGPGTDEDYMKVAKFDAETKAKGKSKNYHRIYHVVSGTNPDAWLYEYPADTMEDLKKSTQTGGGWSENENIAGKEKSDEMNKIYQKTVRWRMREIIKERKDLSSPQPTMEEN